MYYSLAYLYRFYRLHHPLLCNTHRYCIYKYTACCSTYIKHASAVRVSLVSNVRTTTHPRQSIDYHRFATRADAIIYSIFTRCSTPTTLVMYRGTHPADATHVYINIIFIRALYRPRHMENNKGRNAFFN